MPVKEISNRDLLATCWTSAGDAAPFRGDETSPADIRSRIEWVARAGWKGFGLLYADLAKATATMTLKQLRAILDDNGIETVEVEFIVDWWLDGDERRRSDVIRQGLLDAAETVGARTIKVGGDLHNRSVDMGRFCAEFDQLATDAANAGTRVAFEPMPFTNIATIQQGVDLVQTVGNPHGGLAIDIWHAVRGGTAHEELASILPIDQVFVVELNDGNREANGSLWNDTVNHRQLPGDGAFDVPGFIASMHRAGWRGCWGVEIISEAHRAMPIPYALMSARIKSEEALKAAEQLL
jgi:sugar phosphate isomerase/epimerase